MRKRSVFCTRRDSSPRVQGPSEGVRGVERRRRRRVGIHADLRRAVRGGSGGHPADPARVGSPTACRVRAPLGVEEGADRPSPVG